MDHQLLDAICERMNYFLCTEGTYIIREGDPLKVMTFIFRGQLESCTTDGGRVDFFNSIILKPGDFCGEELLTWALLPSSVDRTITEFEGFSLQADDLKFDDAFQMPAAHFPVPLTPMESMGSQVHSVCMEEAQEPRDGRKRIEQ
nr:unnamed protein product [Digitaria exilis]